MQLNPEQKSAVEYVSEPGLGKIQVIISKIEHLISQIGLEPSRILAITFNNKVLEKMDDQKFEPHKDNFRCERCDYAEICPTMET